MKWKRARAARIEDLSGIRHRGSRPPILSKMSACLENVARAVRFLCQGQFRRVWNEVHVRIYRFVYEIIWFFMRPIRRAGRPAPSGELGVDTKYRVAFESPDHIVPFGTAANNSTNKKFILNMDEKVRREQEGSTVRCLDLGCSGGQMVKDFLDLGWIAAGLEGSDYSL